MLKLMLRVVSDSVPPVDRVDQREVADKKTSKKKTFLVHEHLLCHLADLRTINTIIYSAEK